MAEVPSRSGVTGTYLQAYTFGAGTTANYGAASGSWFGPGTPLAPTPDLDYGRQFDYPGGFNTGTQPRRYEPVGFKTLRELADAWDLCSLVIETRKDQVARMSWSVRVRGAKTKTPAHDPRIERLTAFFGRPDGANNWQDWLRAVLDDLFVIDAPALFLRRDGAGNLVALQQIDGATISPMIDEGGRTPQPVRCGGTMIYPAAYQQNIKGGLVYYSTRDLLYRPRNRRAHSPYGRSPVEQIVTTINIALRRQLSQLSYFTAGNIPDAIIQVPKEWTPDQIVAYQKHWDAYFTGDLGARRHVKFVPGMGGSGAVYETRQVDMKGEFDEWLALVVCFAFSVSPQALRKMMNRASAETQKDLAEEEGLEPVLLWVKALLDDIIALEFGWPDLEFAWNDDAEEEKVVGLVKTMVSTGLMTIDEGRQRLGFDPFGTEASSRPMVLTGNGYMPIETPPEPTNPLQRYAVPT